MCHRSVSNLYAEATVSSAVPLQELYLPVRRCTAWESGGRSSEITVVGECTVWPSDGLECVRAALRLPYKSRCRGLGELADLQSS